MQKELVWCIEFNDCKCECKVSIVHHKHKSSDGAIAPCADSLERLHGCACAFSAYDLQLLCAILQGQEML